MTEDFEFEILGNLDCNLGEPFRLQIGELSRNKNEPTAYCPERIPVRLKSEDIGKFSIDAEISGDDEVAKLSSICFVVPVVDSLNKKGGNDIVGQENWSVLTQNWKEGSIASITLNTNTDDKKLDLKFDIWIFVYGLNDSIKLEITAEPRDVVGKPKSITIDFETSRNAPLLPTNTGNSFNNDVILQNERLGAYIGMGNKSSLHPKQVFTSNLLHQIIDRISKIKDSKLRIAYIGLDTGENYFSVNRTLRNLSNISDLTLIHHQEWDDRYMPILRPIIEKNLCDDNFDLTYISTDELAEKAAKKQEEGGIGEYDIIISTFVTSWGGSSVKSTLKNLMTEKTLLLSVEPTQPEFVARSYGSLSPNNIRETFLSSDPAPKMYQVELSNWADYTSDVIQWNAWSIVNNWKDLLLGTSPSPNRKLKTKKRVKYIDAMLNEGPLINCAGYTLDCRELYYANIGEPSFEETSQIGKGEEENQFSDLQDMKFGIVGSAGVGKSIRFRQLFLERISLIKERNFRYRKTPIFIQAREFEKVVKKYVGEASEHEYDHVEFDPYDGLVRYKLTPEDFHEFPYHVVIQILVDSVMATTPGLGKYLEKDLLTELLEDEKYILEIFIDGCDEVSSSCLKWIGILLRETFFDSRVKMDNYEGDAEFVASGNAFLDYIQEYEDVDEKISVEDRDNLKQYMPEDFINILNECEKWNEFHDEVFDAVEAMEEYLVAVIPHRSVTSSYSLSGRPSVKKFLNNVTDANQQRFIDQPYKYKLVELSPIDFSENIHLKIFEGFCRALHIKQEPLQSLLMEVVSQNPDAWNHPFRIGWLVYFICEGKSIQEVGVGISTLSFEKLLIKHIATQSIHNLPEEIQHSKQVHASIVRVITGIACISHPTFGYKFENKIESIRSYLKNNLKQWNFVLNTTMTIDEINHFFMQKVGLYSIDETIHWHHQRVLDAAAAICLEDESNVSSVFSPPIKKPDVFDDDTLKNYPQLCRDRISLIVGSNNVTKYVFSELLDSKLSNSKLKFLYSILQKEEDNLEDYRGLIDKISKKLIENFHDFCPHGFASVQECIEYSNFGGLYHHFTNEHKFQLDTLLMRNMSSSKISVSTLDNIHLPTYMVAKNLALRFASYINSSTKPIAMLGEIVLLGCDDEIINNSTNLIPHVTKYISECGDEGLRKAKLIRDNNTMLETLSSSPAELDKAKITPLGFRILLLLKLESEIFSNVIPAKKREAKSLYQSGKLDEFERYGGFSRIAQRSRIALQGSRSFRKNRLDEDEE